MLIVGWLVKNVDVLCRIDTVWHIWNVDGTLVIDVVMLFGYCEMLMQVISINFIDYGNLWLDQFVNVVTRDVMFVVGCFGLKFFDIINLCKLKLFDWFGDGVGDFYLVDGNLGDGVQVLCKGMIDDMWENEDMDVDIDCKFVFLLCDLCVYGGSMFNPVLCSGIYVIDVRDLEHFDLISFVEMLIGYMMMCVNDCKWVWMGGLVFNID